MEFNLISGQFTLQEIEKLLEAVVKAKIAFHEERLSSIQVTADDLLKSERRIKDLQNDLNKAIARLRAKGKPTTYLNASIEINFTPIMEFQ